MSVKYSARLGQKKERLFYSNSTRQSSTPHTLLYRTGVSGRGTPPLCSSSPVAVTARAARRARTLYCGGKRIVRANAEYCCDRNLLKDVRIISQYSCTTPYGMYTGYARLHYMLLRSIIQGVGTRLSMPGPRVNRKGKCMTVCNTPLLSRG